MTKVSETTKPVLNWADSQLPLEPSEREAALRKRVKMHEFLASGGIQTGVVDGKVVYSGPVDPALTPECPWHQTVPGQTPCAAWEEVKAGRVTNEAEDLARLREMTDEELAERVKIKRAAREEAERKWREDNPDLASKSVAIDLDKKWTPPEPYVRPEKPGPDSAAHYKGGRGERSRYSRHQKAAPKPATVDASALLGEAVPDTIEIDGEED